MNLPLILEIIALVSAVRAIVVTYAVFPNVIAEWATAIGNRATVEGFPPIDVEAAVRIIVDDLVRNPVQRISDFEGVLLARNAFDVGAIQIDVVAGQLVRNDRE